MKADTPFKLGQCTIKPREYSIEFSSDNNKVLQPKFIEVLAYLASQFPRLVDRQELIDNVWAGNHYVGEKSLTNAIWNLRNEFKQMDPDNEYIETVRKKGYRLLIKPLYLSDETAQQHIVPPSQTSKLTTPRTISYLVIVGLIILTSIWALSNHSVVPLQGTITSITTDPGREVYPVVSPNNQYLIYSWRRIGKQPNLYLKNFSELSAPAKQLTFSEDYEGRAVWHPDGENIYFQRKHWDYSQCEIIQLNIITTEQKVITPCTGEVDFALTISPDGDTLAYVYVDGKSSIQTIQFLDIARGISTAIPYQCKNKCQYKDLDAAFSPDGKYLVISRSLDEEIREEIFLFDVNSKELQQLTDVDGDIKGLTWHQSSGRIIFSTEASGRRDGYVFSLDDNKTSKLNIPGFSYPNAIPNSNDVIFHHWQVLSHLSTLSLSDTIATAPFPFIRSEYSYRSPHFSEVANKMVFISNESGYEEIWTSNIDGTDRQKLTSLERYLTFPRWSHNGEYIAFLGPKKQEKGNALYILNVKSNLVKKLNSDFEQHFRPSWLQDDSGLIAATKNSNQVTLHAFPINHQQSYILLNQAVTFAEQDEAGNIWYTPGRNQGLWRFSPTQHSPSPIEILSSDLFRVGHNWELTNQGVYFQHDYAKHHQINYFEFNTQKVKPVVKLPKGTLQRNSSMTFIEQEDKLVFTQLEFPKVNTKRLTHPLLQ